MSTRLCRPESFEKDPVEGREVTASTALVVLCWRLQTMAAYKDVNPDVAVALYYFAGYVSAYAVLTFECRVMTE